MAGGDNGLRRRAITEDHNEEESADYQLVVNHFRENKVEIASAITKPFPFLMSLRDRCIISEEKFQDCEKRCEKQEQVERVVYDILSDVQKKFSWQLLKVIFSKAHLKAYPDLEEILQNFFQNALDNHRTFQRMNGRDAEKRPRLSAVDREASCSPGASHMNDDRAEEVPSLPQCNGGGGGPGASHMNDDGAEEVPSLPQCNGGGASPGASHMNDDGAEEVPSLPQCDGGGASPGASHMNDDGAEEVPSLPQCNGGSGGPGASHMSDDGAEEVPSLPQCDGGGASPGASHMSDDGAEEVLSLPQCNGGGVSPGASHMNDDGAEEVPSLPQCNGGGVSPGASHMSDDGAEEVPSLPQCDRGGASPGASHMNDDGAEEVPSLPQCDGGGGGRGASHMNDDGAEEVPSLPQCDGGEAEQSTSGGTCPCVMCSPAYVTEDPEARLGSSQREAMDPGNSIPVGKPKKSRGKRKKGHNWSKPKRRRLPNVWPKSKQTEGPCSSYGSRAYGQAAFRRMEIIKSPGSSAKLRVLRRRRNENAHFDAELLPVTCGDMKGVLHKHKFKQGVSVMSIQCKDGNWFTPSEFEVMGGHGKSKNWKLSLRCYNWPLKFLIKRNFLPNPPRKYAKRGQMQNSDECEMCPYEGTLFCCDTCPRAFHKECHIPAVDIEKTPWSCVFCRIQSLGSQESCPESEILQRQMSPQEQLKCEFVLLKVYCCPERSFFSKMPYYCYLSDVARDVPEPMWLDRIKRKLSTQAYSKVEEFVNDMRLIFQNHRSTFKDAKFGQIGLILESKFETNFKEVFAVQETNENS